MHVKRRILIAALMAGAALPAAAHDTARDSAERKSGLFKPGVSIAHEHAQPALGEGRPPLYDGLGGIGFNVSTSSREAQAYFDQGLALAWAFNHAEARRAFREAQRLDPSCAMCAWGEAYVLGPYINDVMAPEAVAPAHAAATRAMALREGAGEKERALIEAISLRYAPEGVDRAGLDEAWADALVAAAARWPDDPDLLALAAEALMNLQPWDYWEADGVTSKGRGAEIVALLERALALDPDHPAAIHFYIHAVEASATPERAEPYADRLRGATPALGHLVHMPAHIYMRVGRHADLIAVNRDAAAADERMLEQAGEAASPLYRFGYYPHNVHFQLVGAQMSGLGDEAIGAAEKLDAILSDEMVEKLGWVQAIKTAPYAVHSLFSDPDTILALPAPPASMPFVVGYWRYARGIGHVRAGDLDAAREEAAAIERLIAEGDFAGLEAQYMPARTVLKTAQHALEGKIGQAAGRLGEAERHLREAAALQDGIPYMEPPYWHYPVRQTLGAVLLRQGRHREAAEAFRAALDATPRNGWTLWGLAETLRASGDEAGAAEAQARLDEAWLGDPALLGIDRM